MPKSDASLFRQIYEKPESFAQLVSAILLVAAFVMVVVGWGVFEERRMQVPLIALGVTAILLLVLLSRKHVAISLLATVIIGTIVTSEEFLLKVATLASGETGAVEESFYGTSREPGFNPEQLSKIVAELIQQELGSKATPEATKKIEEILTRAELERIGQRVRSTGAYLPLRELVKGVGSWGKFVDKWEDKEFFKKDMAFLRSEGLAQCQPDDDRSCEVTKIGREVNETLRSDFREGLGVKEVLIKKIQKNIATPDPQKEEVDKTSAGEAAGDKK